MCRILLIDDDETVREAISRLLALNGHKCVAIGTGREGIRLIELQRADVAIVDYRLPDMSGLDVFSELAGKCPGTARILLTGYATVDVAIQAMRQGACDCVTKPASQQDILKAIDRALARQPPHTCLKSAASHAESSTPVPHAAVRVAGPLVRVIDEPADPRTLRKFAKAAGISVGGFRNWCRTANLKSRAVAHFARALRAVYLAERDRTIRPENLLKIVDRRTVTKFVAKAGGKGDQLPDTVSDFLARQQFISDREVIEAVRQALAERQA